MVALLLRREFVLRRATITTVFIITKEGRKSDKKNLFRGRNRANNCVSYQKRLQVPLWGTSVSPRQWGERMSNVCLERRDRGRTTPPRAFNASLLLYAGSASLMSSRRLCVCMYLCTPTTVLLYVQHHLAAVSRAITTTTIVALEKPVQYAYASKNRRDRRETHLGPATKERDEREHYQVNLCATPRRVYPLHYRGSGHARKEPRSPPLSQGLRAELPLGATHARLFLLDGKQHTVVWHKRDLKQSTTTYNSVMKYMTPAPRRPLEAFETRQESGVGIGKTATPSVQARNRT